jgi:putative lipoprotein
VINDVGATGILQEAANLAKDANDKLFADVRGRLTGSKQANNDGQLEVRRLYRLEPSTRACEDPNFKQLTLRANGHDRTGTSRPAARAWCSTASAKSPCPCRSSKKKCPAAA